MTAVLLFDTRSATSSCFRSNSSNNLLNAIASSIGFKFSLWIFDEKLSVRDTEKLVKEIKNPKKPKEKVKTVNDFIYKDLANKMKEVMGTKVSIASKGNGKGKIEIEYYSDEELERMFDMIMSIGKEE